MIQVVRQQHIGTLESAEMQFCHDFIDILNVHMPVKKLHSVTDEWDKFQRLFIFGTMQDITDLKRAAIIFEKLNATVNILVENGQDIEHYSKYNCLKEYCAVIQTYLNSVLGEKPTT